MAANARTDLQTLLTRGLTGVLADTYSLYNATQVCHWNVTGPRFAALHEMFEEQYTELAAAIDEIAERIRALGYLTPGTLGELRSASRLNEAPGLRDTADMLDHLVTGHQQVVHRLREVQGIAEEAVDEATIDLLVERMRVHEKALWMLQSQAGEEAEDLTVLPDLATAMA